jgi:hypothetical protein
LRMSLLLQRTRSITSGYIHTICATNCTQHKKNRERAAQRRVASTRRHTRPPSHVTDAHTQRHKAHKMHEHDSHMHRRQCPQLHVAHEGRTRPDHEVTDVTRA